MDEANRSELGAIFDNFNKVVGPDGVLQHGFYAGGRAVEAMTGQQILPQQPPMYSQFPGQAAPQFGTVIDPSSRRNISAMTPYQGMSRPTPPTYAYGIQQNVFQGQNISAVDDCAGIANPGYGM